MKTIVAVLLLSMLAAIAGTTNGIPNFDVVEPGLYRGGQPNAEGWRYLKSLGVRVVVKLNTEREGSDQSAEALGMKVRRYPITKWQQTLGKPRLLGVWTAAYNLGTNTFVHCSHGQDRTGLIVAAHRVLVDKWTKRQAEKEMLAHGFHPLLHGLWWSFENDL